MAQYQERFHNTRNVRFPMCRYIDDNVNRITSIAFSKCHRIIVQFQWILLSFVWVRWIERRKLIILFTNDLINKQHISQAINKKTVKQYVHNTHPSIKSHDGWKDWQWRRRRRRRQRKIAHFPVHMKMNNYVALKLFRFESAWKV